LLPKDHPLLPDSKKPASINLQNFKYQQFIPSDPFYWHTKLEARIERGTAAGINKDSVTGMGAQAVSPHVGGGSSWRKISGEQQKTRTILTFAFSLAQD